MRKIALAVIAVSTVLTGAAADARSRQTPQQELAALLAGREAGKPQQCISQFDARDIRVIDGTALVFGWGNTLWVNVPRNPSTIDADDVLVTRNSGSQFCSVDIIQTLDRGSLNFNGTLSLGDFVPYRRVKASQ